MCVVRLVSKTAAVDVESQSLVSHLVNVSHSRGYCLAAQDREFDWNALEKLTKHLLLCNVRLKRI